MKNHSQTVRSLIESALDGDLPPEDWKSLENQIPDSPESRQALQMLKRLTGRLKPSSPELSFPDLTSRIRSRLTEPALGRFPAWGLSLPLAVCAMALFAFLTLRQGGTGADMSSSAAQNKFLAKSPRLGVAEKQELAEVRPETSGSQTGSERPAEGSSRGGQSSVPPRAVLAKAGPPITASPSRPQVVEPVSSLALLPPDAPQVTLPGARTPQRAAGGMSPPSDISDYEARANLAAARHLGVGPEVIGACRSAGFPLFFSMMQVAIAAEGGLSISEVNQARLDGYDWGDMCQAWGLSLDKVRSRVKAAFVAMRTEGLLPPPPNREEMRRIVATGQRTVPLRSRQ